MICPHCKKPISYNVSAEALKRAKQLRKQNYSFRDIEKLRLTEARYAATVANAKLEGKVAVEAKELESLRALKAEVDAAPWYYFALGGFGKFCETNFARLPVRVKLVTIKEIEK